MITDAKTNSAFQHRMKEKIKNDIEESGWTTIAVLPSTGDSDYVSFSYTVGFREHEQPEIIVMGLPPEYAHAMLRTLYDRVATGETLSDGQHLSEVLDGYDVLLRAVPEDGKPLNMARAYYAVDKLPALQMVWPDEAGLFPGDEGCDENVVTYQDLVAVREEDERRNAQDAQKSRWADGLPMPTGGLPDYSLPHVEGVVSDGEELFQMFQSWSSAEQIDLSRFWDEFDIEAEALMDFSRRCGMAMNTAPPIIGLMLTFGAVIAKGRFRPKGQPEITI